MKILRSTQYLLTFLSISVLSSGSAFVINRQLSSSSVPRRPSVLCASSSSSASNGLNGDSASSSSSNTKDKASTAGDEPSVWDCTLPSPEKEAQARIASLKRDLFQLGASYNRGFAASPKARTTVLDLIEQLEGLNSETNAANGVDGSLPQGTTTTASASTKTTVTACPLEGTWRLIWTTGPDVLVLDANPFLTVGAIYQVFEPPLVTNVIDLQPKIQALVPPSVLPNTLLRARVETRANLRAGKPNRVGLVFERVQVQPLQLLGSNIDVFPPLGFDLPRFGAASAPPSNADSPGYFEVTFLDDDVLVYRQQMIGAFVFIKVDDMEV